MAATKTITYAPAHPKSGVLILSGYGISARVERGHLELEDGVGRTRRRCRLPRVRHGLRRLVVIGADGMVSLAALRWLAAQDASFVMLDRDGSVLLTTGPVRSSDVRLRRAQALAAQSGAALRISQELIAQKLLGQEQIARDTLTNFAAAVAIAGFRTALGRAKTTDAVRVLESKGALAYWAAWRDIEIRFPHRDLPRVPDHWRVFDSRLSPLTISPRLATNPVNAMLNYLYAVLESEARLAAAALGLDPGFGALHTDTKARDSLACDIMEPVRPRVDAFVLNWIRREPLKREWFFEQPDGNCRLMDSFAAKLAETAPNWAGAVAPIAESVARAFWSTARVPKSEGIPATRLTQQYRREAKGSSPLPPARAAMRPVRICRSCGVDIAKAESDYCPACRGLIQRRRFVEVARLGRELARLPEARAKHAQSHLKQVARQQGWNPASLPEWLNKEAYWSRVQPKLAPVAYSKIAAVLDVSKSYAANVKAGRFLPHPRHWRALAELAGITEQN